MALSYLLSITDLPTLQAAYVTRLADNVALDWISEEGKQTGNAFAVLNSIALSLGNITQELQYAKASLRFATATYPELDTDSLDYYGGSLPRVNNEDDATYSMAITANLFNTAITRAAVYGAMTVIYPGTVRMIEPYRLQDVGSMGRKYVDIDTTDNPSRVQSAPNATAMILFSNATVYNQSAVYSRIEAVKAYGVTIGCQFTSTEYIVDENGLFIVDENGYKIYA